MELAHRFYQKSKKEQNKIQLVISVGASTVALFSVLLSYLTGLYFIAVFFIAILLSVIAPFFDTPAMKKSGKLVYYSPLFLTELEKNGVVSIHGGTLLDYVFVIDRNLTGSQRTKFIIISYLEGLLKLIDDYEVGKGSPVKIKGTSYIINRKTAQRLGFSVVSTDLVQKIVLLFNYVNLAFLLSIAKAKLTLPDLSEIITLETDPQTLIQKKNYLLSLHKKLTHTTASAAEV